MYGTIAKWMEHGHKLWADIYFNHCFCDAIWDPRYRMLISADPNRGDTAKAGFIAQRIARYYCDLEGTLEAHSEGNWKNDQKFEPYVLELVLPYTVHGWSAKSAKITYMYIHPQSGPDLKMPGPSQS